MTFYLASGKRSEKVEQHGHEALSTFGIGADLGESEWRSIARQLIAREAIRVEAELKAWRAQVAREHNLPAYVIFHDATLRAIAEAQPQRLADLEGIPGLGQKKLEAYGAEVLRVVNSGSQGRSA